MNLNLCIVSATPALITEALQHAASRAHEGLNVHYFMNAHTGSMAELQESFNLLQYPNVRGAFGASSDENLGCTLGMHRIWERWRKDAQPDDLFVYIHDDLNILEEGWDVRVKKLFRERPQVKLAGFGGATQLGNVSLYKQPYELNQLARFRFMSNMTNATQHGACVGQETQVATLDSFTLILRASFLEELGGWEWWPYPCHNFDNAVCCEARRRGYETWFIPVYCHHKGGETSCRPMYQQWAQEKFGGDRKVHTDSHALLYDRYRDVLPVIV